MRHRDPVHVETDVLVGTPYRALRMLGKGSMATAYAAVHRVLGRSVCVKLLHPGLVENTMMLDRMRLEAQALSVVKHPAVLAVLDFGVTPGGQPFLVTELLHGATLHEWLTKCLAFPPSEVIAIGCSLLSALEVVHRQGLVHRDVKPGNLFLTRSGKVKLLDFGVAKLLAPHPAVEPLARSTTTKTLIGTPRYMAPEQIEGGTVDGRIDIYAAGMTLYVLACGEGPFDRARRMSDLLSAIVHESPRPPSSREPGVSPELERIILRALEKDPAARYQSATEMRADLLALAQQPARRQWWVAFASAALVSFALGLFLVAMLMAGARGNTPVGQTRGPAGKYLSGGSRSLRPGGYELARRTVDAEPAVPGK